MAVEQFGVEFFASGFLTLENQLQKIDNKIDGLGQTSQKASNFISNTLSVALGNVLSKSIEVATGALVRMGEASVQFLGDSFNAAVDFETSITKLRIAAGATEEEMNKLHDAAIAVGGASNLVGVDASQAAEAMTALFKSGLTTTEVLGDLNAVMEDGNQVSGALRASIDLAAATTLDMVQAADLASKLMATFGGDAKEAGVNIEDWVVSAMDNLVKAADASVAEVEGLSHALTFVGPTAASAGLSLEETTNALALLSLSGIEASTAGTNLRQMLNSLIAPTKEGSETLGALGVSMFNSDGSARDFTEVLFDLNQALFGTNEITVEVGGRTKEQNDRLEEAQKRYAQLTKRIQNHNDGLTTMSDSALAKANAELGNASAIISELSGIQGKAVQTTKQLTDAEREQAIGNIFTTQGANALKVILQQINDTNEDGVDGWTAMLQATENATGIQEQAAAKAATFAGRMEALRGVIETLQIQIGEALLPVAGELINKFIQITEDEGPKIVDIFKKAAEFVTIFGEILIDLINQNPDAAFARMGGAMTKAFGGEFAVSFMTKLQGIMKTINELGKIVSSVFDSVSKIFTENIMPDIQKIGDSFSELGITWEDVSKVIGVVATAIGIIIIGVIGIIAALVDSITSAVAVIVERLPAITEGFSTMWQGIQQFINSISQAINALFDGDMNLAKEMFNKSLEGIIKIGQGFSTALINIFIAFGSAIIAQVSSFVDSIIKFFQNLAKELVGNSIVPDMLSAIIEAFVQFGIDVLDNMAEFITTLLEFMSLKLEEFYQLVSSKLNEIKSFWAGVWVSILEDLRGNLNAMITMVTEKAQAIYDAITSKIASIGDWITEQAQTMVAWGKTIIDNIVSGINEIADNIKNAVTTAINAIGNGIDSVKETLKGFGTSIINFIAEGITGAGNTIATAISGILSGIQNAVQFGQEVIAGLASIGAKIVSFIVEGIAGGVTSIINAIKDLVFEAFTTFLPDIISQVVETVMDLLRRVPGLSVNRPDNDPDIPSIVSNNPLLSSVPVLNTLGGQSSPSITNNNTNNYNLTTQSTTSPGTLAMEFETMTLIGR